MSRPNWGEFLKTRGLFWLPLAIILLFNGAIRWRLLGMPLERDEGEYAYAGQLLLQGIPPYQIAWNMKFPGTYYAYAALMSVFGQTPEGIHYGIILVTSASTILIFLIGRRLMGAVGGLLAAALFTMLSALPFAYGLAGHATHFVVLFVCAGTFAVLKMEGKKPALWALFAGAAFGTAVLMKQHALIFAVAAAGWLLWRKFRRKEKSLCHAGAFIAGAALPLLLTVAVLVQSGVWNRFVFWTIQYARQYVSIFPVSMAPRQFAVGFGPIFESGAWVWLAGFAGMALVFLRTRHRRAAVLGAGLFLAGMAGTFPGLYFRGHYFLMAMPGLALLNAAFFLALADKLKQFPHVRMLKLLPVFLFLGVAGDFVMRNAATWFIQTPDEVCRKLYGLSPFPESPEIARYIEERTRPDDTIAVLGSEPQIFFLAHRRSASGYIYFYSLTEPQPMSRAMRDEFFHEVESAKPKYVVYDHTFFSWCQVFVPDETDDILAGLNQRWNDYSQNYQLVGMVDIGEGESSQFFWDEQLSGRTNTLPSNISIYQRK